MSISGTLTLKLPTPAVPPVSETSGNGMSRLKSLRVNPWPPWKDQPGISKDSGKRPRALPLTKRSEEHTSELQSLMRISYAVFCLKTKNNHLISKHATHQTQLNDTETPPDIMN